MYKQRLIQALEENPFEQLTTVIYNIIKEEIISLRLQPDAKINLSELATSLDTSRTPVRDAMKRLCDEKLMKIEPGKKGYFVRSISKNTMEQLFVSRKMIEGEAAYMLALNYYNIDLAPLYELAEKYKDTFHSNDYEEYSAVEVGFHKGLVELTNNPFFIQMYETIETMLLYYTNMLKGFRMSQIAAPPSTSQSLPVQHLSICKAIETGVPQIAQEALLNHLRSGEYYMQHYIFDK